MAQRGVKITRGDDEVYVPARSVSTWEANGWTAADDGSTEESSEPTPAPAKKTAKKATTRKAD